MIKGHLTRPNPKGDEPAPTLGGGTRPRHAPAVGLKSFIPRFSAAALLLGCSIAAQSPGVPLGLPGEGQATSRFPKRQPSDGTPLSMDQKRIAVLNRMRQRAIVSDTDRLLLLAKELNADSASMAAAERVRKAGEIEKLAKSVKEKMSYAVGDNPTTPGSVNLFP